MKKFLVLSAVALSFVAMPALADNHGDKGGKGGKLFEKHDTDGDGVISKEEFLDHAGERFSKMDKDGDGSVSKEEAKEGAKERRAQMKERMEERKERRESAE